MKRNYVWLIIVGSLLWACNQQKEGETESANITNEAIEEPTDPKATEIWEPVPPTVAPAKHNLPPSDAIVLFNGEHFGEWINTSDSSEVKWQLDKEARSMTTARLADNKNTSIQTKRNFGDVQLHLEWKSSEEIKGDGQNRSNSGVFLQNRYEVQVLDNNNNPTYVNGMVGAIYKQSIPLAKALVPTGEWNIYDIIYHAPRFDSLGHKTQSATITVLLNGILIQDHFEIQGTTEYVGFPKNDPHGKAPIMLQDHDCAVSYRNIWVREINN